MTIAPEPDNAGGRTRPPSASTTPRSRSFEDLHREYDPYLNRYLRSRVPPDDEPDVRQETWHQFYLRWTAHPDHPQPRALLTQIAWCRIADHWRAAKGTPPPMDADDLQALADALAAELPQARVDTRRDIVAALSRLTAQQREALAWHYIAQATLPETAMMMGLRTDNTKRILGRARQLLRAGLPDYRITATSRREQK